jgi:protoheme IX farnesyltransferase
VVLFTILLLLASVLPTRLGLSGSLYLASALTLGALFLALGVAMAFRRDDRSAMRLFLGSVAYLPLLLLTMVIDRLIA